MTGIRHVPRSRGVLSGALLVLLGAWGALLPFVGPYFDFGFAPDRTWVYDTDRLQLSVAPGAATALGGLIVLAAASRAFAATGAWLAALGGAWFAVGPQVAVLWDAGGVGAPLGTEEGRRVGEQLAGFTALGVLIVFFAALALGRFAVVGVKDVQIAEAQAEADRARAEEARRDEAGDDREDAEDAPSHATTQPFAPPQGRYGRGAPAARPPAPADPDDQRVAGRTLTDPPAGTDRRDGFSQPPR
ncbi:hypothetical protein [Actinomadura parmotrematis]|uniref:Uncharacterized protein n=1 Tax=Actinomadura parmotrematis TaxID=2864039 RepID=A0ABS7FLD2_9ACTN|nr:hypothetical protein [Actinomadura parmotrematis]MBW8481175.1 hypothetical protein [Actinomadura parmotrematis]